MNYIFTKISLLLLTAVIGVTVAFGVSAAYTATPTLFKPANTHGLNFFVKHFRNACFNDNIFWYNSQGGIEDLYKSCQDDNACTLDRCRDNGCSHTLMCDGTTCGSNTDEFKQYCSKEAAPITLASNTVQSAQGNTTLANNEAPYGNLAIAIFGKKSSDPLQWQKVVRASDGEQIDFLVTVKNAAQTPIENVSLKVNLNNNVAYAYNLKVDSVASNEDIANKVLLGTINPKDARAVTFTGLAKTGGDIAVEGIVLLNDAEVDHDSFQITIAAISQNNPAGSDSINQNSQVAQAAAVGTVKQTNPALKFLMSWYLWGGLAIGVVIITLFIIIFRRLSAEV